MRYIDTTSLVIPNNWRDLARQENSHPIWSYLKPIFESIVGKKCWYNESINDGTSNPIDHFRPKTTQVKILSAKYANLDKIIWQQLSTSDQVGYPFLEFESLNYRYACGFANSAHTRESTDGVTRGKWDFFPIKLGSNVARNINDLSTEIIALLDPCNVQDPMLLTFNEFGGVEASESVLTGSWDFCRVMVSIEVYHLMYHVISTKRRELWASCVRSIDLLSVLYNKSNKTPEEQLAFDHLYHDFITSLQKKSSYSAVVIDCVKYYKKRKDPLTYKWLHQVIPDLMLTK